MNLIGTTLGGAALGMLLSAGFTAPTLADKISQSGIDTPAVSTPTAPADITIATPIDAIDFGDDSSQWAKDGECDDPRFKGTGSATELVDADRLKDATDCRAAYEAGSVTLVEAATATAPTPPTDTPADIPTAPADIAIATPIDAIDFGDDSSEWSKDGECDDPRFAGTGSAAELVDADIRKDATDCKAAYAAGTVTLKEAPTASTMPTTPADSTTTSPADIAIATPIDAIDFGDDTSEWAKDGECDDPRFAGTGAAAEPLGADTLKDATDCKAAYAAGTVTLKDAMAAGTATTTPTITSADIDFGDDSGNWSKDGECDDPRFAGTGMASTTVDDDISKDATDCKAAFDAGTISLLEGGEIPPPDTNVAVATGPFDYGADWSEWANDGECDDLRFTGPGTDKKLLSEDMLGDATDCKTLETAGKVTIRTVYTPEYAAGAPYDSAGISFGDNASDYANDSLCDDPRFEGPGAAAMLLDGDLEHDSVDCKAAYEAGTIVLRAGA